MNEFNQRIAREVFYSYPEWEVLAASETWKGSGPFVVVTVPAPAEANTRGALTVSTWGEEVIVAFDHYHTHFGKWTPAEDDGPHDAALLYVRDLLAEKVAVISWWYGNLCKACAQYLPGTALKPCSNIRWTHVRIRSWQGNLNADVSA